VVAVTENAKSGICFINSLTMLVFPAPDGAENMINFLSFIFSVCVSYILCKISNRQYKTLLHIE